MRDRPNPFADPFTSICPPSRILLVMEALLAYDESLAAVQFIGDTYGISDLQRILQRLGEGNSTEAALRATIHDDYGQLQGEVRKYLIGKYGD